MSGNGNKNGRDVVRQIWKHLRPLHKLTIVCKGEAYIEKLVNTTGCLSFMEMCLICQLIAFGYVNDFDEFYEVYCKRSQEHTRKVIDHR